MITVSACLRKGKAEGVTGAKRVVECSSIGGDGMGYTIMVRPGNRGPYLHCQALWAERKARDGDAVPATGRRRRWRGSRYRCWRRRWRSSRYRCWC